MMTMNVSLANALMDCLANVAISANGCAQYDENGEPILTEQQAEVVRAYVDDTFRFLMKEWEETLGDRWRFVEDGN